jgi:hypothetical protein
LLFTGCISSSPVKSSLPTPPHSATTTPTFTDVTQEAGIRFKHTHGGIGKKYFVEMMGSGAAWFDYDNDGNLDLYLINGALLKPPNPPTAPPPTNVLYRNNGDGTFTDVTAQSGLGDVGYGMGVAVGDIDNDGDADVYVTNFGQNRLYLNNGNGTFTDGTARARVGNSGFSTSAAFVDYDRDGFLDLYVCRYVQYSIEHDIPCLNPAGEKQYCEVNAYDGADDILYHNNGDGTFTDVSTQVDITGKRGKGLAVTCFDYDDDGDTDIFVANDLSGNILWRNEGNGRFTDVALRAGVQVDLHGKPPAGMGADVGDYDHDGRLDLYISNYQLEPNLLFRNEGKGFFADKTGAAYLSEPTLPFLGFGLGFLDVDLDGNRDLFVANGHVMDDVQRFNPKISYAQTPQLFLNRGDGTFADISRTAGASFRVGRVGRGAAFGDYDNDGDVDVVVACNNGPAVLFRNDTPRKQHFLTLKLIGSQSNRDAVGARVEVITGNLKQVDEVRSGNSYLSRSDLRLNFGLGERKRVDTVRVRWLGGAVSEVGDVAADQFVTIVEGKGVMATQRAGNR